MRAADCYGYADPHGRGVAEQRVNMFRKGMSMDVGMYNRMGLSVSDVTQHMQ